jgi:hypothetical protein
MSIQGLCQWLEQTALCTALRESNDVYPILLTGHLAALAVLGGLLLVSDLRLIGFALKDFPVSQIVGRMRTWKRVGLVVMLSIGFLLFSAKAAEYYANPWFRVKMILLVCTGVHAFFFRDTVYSRTAELDGLKELPGSAKIAGWVSLALWTGIVIMGRAIGYYDAPGAP